MGYQSLSTTAYGDNTFNGYADLSIDTSPDSLLGGRYRDPHHLMTADALMMAHGDPLHEDLDDLETFVMAPEVPILHEPATPVAGAGDIDLLNLESSFCRDFTCCGLVLHDMHELLQHYEECHVHLEDDSDNELDAFPDAFLPDEDGYDFGDDLSSSCSIPPFDMLSESGLTDPPFSPQIDPSLILVEADRPISAFDDSVIRKSSGNKRKRSNPLVRRVGDVEDDLGLRVIEAVKEEVDRGGKRLRMVGDTIVDYDRWPSKSEDGSVMDDDSDGDDGSVVATIDSNGDVKKSKKPEKSQQSKSKRESPMFVDENGNRIEKPYRCTYPGCDKAYKNANGLKYHNLHGHCEGDEEDVDFASRLLKPYVCSFQSCFKRYKNLNGLKYHMEKAHCLAKTEANQMATSIVKKTNAEYGIHARSVPSHVLLNAIKKKEELDKDNPVSGMSSAEDTPRMSTLSMDKNFRMPNVAALGKNNPNMLPNSQLDQSTLLKTLLLAKMMPQAANASGSPMQANYQRALQTLFPFGIPANVSTYLQALAASGWLANLQKNANGSAPSSAATKDASATSKSKQP